jgi:biotin operon repressor
MNCRANYSEGLMPRYRGTKEGAATLVGRLLLIVAAGKETSATLAAKLRVSDRQVNRYILQLKEAGWQIERRGVPTHQDYFFELVAPQIILPDSRKRTSGKRKE